MSTAFVYPGKEEMESLQELAADVGDSINLLPYDIKEEYRAFGRDIAKADAEDLKPEYTELFLTRMFCPTSETIYGKNSFNTPNILGDISGYYKAFGFTLSDKAHVPHDNIVSSVPGSMVFNTRLNAVSRIRVARIRSSS